MKYISAVLFGLFFSISVFADTIKFQEDRSLPTVYLNIIIQAGAIHDPVHKKGLATVASNMLLRGTIKRNKMAFLSTLDRLGASIDADVRPEAIVFRVVFLSENAPKVLELISETLTEPRFAKEELNKLKKEVVGAILVEKANDAQLAARHYTEFLYGNHPYANPITGTERGVNTIRIHDVHQFYNTYFGTTSMQIYGSGDIDAQSLNKWWENLLTKFSAIHPLSKAGARIAQPQITPGRRILLVDKPGATQSHVFMGHQAPRATDPGYYALHLANHVYGGGTFQARLLQEVRVKRGWTYGASNRIALGPVKRHFTTYFFPKTTDTAPATKLVLGMYEDFINKGITQEEFEFAQSALVNSAPFALDTPRKQLENNTVESLYSLPDGFFKDFSTNISTVAFSDTLPAVQSSFSVNNLTVVVFGDAQKLRPELSKIPNLGKLTVIPHNKEN